MANITLSIDDETIKNAKIKAVQDGVSLSAKVRELLKRYISGQLDQAAPDLSFVQNALLFSAKTTPEVNETVAAAGNDAPPPLDDNGITVNTDYLRSVRGWAREDLYDRPTNYGKSAK